MTHRWTKSSAKGVAIKLILQNLGLLVARRVITSWSLTTPPGVDVLDGGKLTSNNVAGSLHDPLQTFVVASCAVSKPGGDAAGQDALHSAGVEGSEDAGLIPYFLSRLRKKRR